jgi:Fibrobacter succinogenes major domain (Fib_succ_major).
MNSELGIRNVGCVLALVMTFFTACTDYQEQFDNNFAALEYGDIENPELSSGVVPGSSHGTTPASSASAPASSGVGPLSSGAVPASSGAEPLSSGAVPASSGAEPLSSGAVPASSGAEPQYSETVPPQSSGEQPSSSVGSSSSFKLPSVSVSSVNMYSAAYTVVTIGEQTWMAENMKRKDVDNVCLRNFGGECIDTIRFYKWDQARDICPEGWRLPKLSEWQTLFDAVGGQENAGKVLKSTDGNGSDGVEFNALLVGYVNSKDQYQYLDEKACFWVGDGYGQKIVEFQYLSDKAYFVPVESGDAYSVRCIKDAKSLSSSSVKSSSSSVKSSSSVSSSSFVFESNGNYTDPRTGLTFKYVKYNGLVWMDQDLNYRESDVQYTQTTLGTLYSWENAKKACPPDWRLPTIDEFNKSVNLENYSTLNGNEPGALRGYFLMTDMHDPDYEGMYWLSPSTSSSSYDYLYAVQFNSKSWKGTVVHIDKDTVAQYPGSAVFAVRCVTETLTPTQVERSSSSASFISKTFFDDTEYPTVTIGGHKWMAKNLNYYKGELENPSYYMSCRGSSNTDLKLCNNDGGGDGIYYDYNSAARIAAIGASFKNAQTDLAWTLPSESDAKALLAAVGNEALHLWSPNMGGTKGGTNQSGFYVLNSGYHEYIGAVYQYHDPKYEQKVETCFWLWSGTNPTSPKALCFYPDNNTSLYEIAPRPKENLYPIRLIYGDVKE